MIIDRSGLKEVRAEFNDASIALRFGCYDVLHAGHQLGIDIAASRADILVVGVMPDDYARKVKGPSRPYVPEGERVQAIDIARGVDYSFIAPPGILGLAGVFLDLRPNVYVEEDEHDTSRAKSAFLKSLGIERFVDRDTRIGSTSAMIASLGAAEALSRSSLSYAHE